ncbi:MAG TPA: hypothetical protein VGO57_00830 [Verrucomicrobiae bacterium]|jgi:hypothetical protein
MSNLLLPRFPETNDTLMSKDPVVSPRLTNVVELAARLDATASRQPVSESIPTWERRARSPEHRPPRISSIILIVKWGLYGKEMAHHWWKVRKPSVLSWALFTQALNFEIKRRRFAGA